MFSKIFIDLNTHKDVHIRLTRNDSDDVRDKMVAMFIQEAAPAITTDGFCMIRSVDPENQKVYEIVPIHPLDMPRFIGLIFENATHPAYGGMIEKDRRENLQEVFVKYLEAPARSLKEITARLQEANGYLTDKEYKTVLEHIEGAYNAIHGGSSKEARNMLAKAIDILKRPAQIA
jgi:hypothetical protein